MARRQACLRLWRLGAGRLRGLEACRLGASMDILGAHGMLLVAPWEFLGSSWAPLGALEGALELLGAPWMLLGNSVVFLESAWLLLGSSWSFLGRSLGWTRGGLSRLASISSALLGVIGVEMLQNVAVAKEWAVFLQKCCCGLRSGGVPLEFLSHRPLGSQFAYNTNAFCWFWRPPGAEGTRVGGANDPVSGV